jgi:predicted component of type VI protein secretion system
MTGSADWARNGHSLDGTRAPLFNERHKMYAVVITDEGGVRRRLDFSKPELTVGRVQGNDIVLAKRNVSKQHARLTLKDNQAIVVDLNSTNGTWVNGRKITSPYPLKRGDKIYIADFILTLEPANDGAARASTSPGVSEPPPLPPKSSKPQTAIPMRHSVADKRPRVADSRAPIESDAGPTSLPPSIEERATDAPQPPASAETVVADPLSRLLTRLAERVDIETTDPRAMKNQDRWSATRAAIAKVPWVRTSTCARSLMWRCTKRLALERSTICSRTMRFAVSSSTGTIRCSSTRVRDSNP